MRGQLLMIAGLVAAAIALLWTGLWWWSVRSVRAATREPVLLTPWQKLCHVHELPAEDVQRLEDIGRMVSLSDPLLIFVDPRVLRSASAQSDGGPYARLGEQLFGEAFRV